VQETSAFSLPPLSLNKAAFLAGIESHDVNLSQQILLAVIYSSNSERASRAMEKSTIPKKENRPKNHTNNVLFGFKP